MNKNNTISAVIEKLNAYKRKYYTNQLVKGLIYLFGLAISLFIIITTLEFFLYLSSPTRIVLLLFFLGASALIFFKFVFFPLLGLFKIKEQLSNADAAKQLGVFFPEISDKLLNIIELNGLDQHSSSLIEASIRQKFDSIKRFDFKRSINIKKENKSIVPYLLIPTVVLLLFLSFLPSMISEAGYRLVKFNQEFVKPAPFTFSIVNDSISAFKGDDFPLKVKLEGEKLPASIFINRDGVKLQMVKSNEQSNQYTFRFSQIAESFEFRLEAAGYQSKAYKLEVFERPSLNQLIIELDYPEYVGLENERIINAGKFIVPEGTKSIWKLKAKATEQAKLVGSKDVNVFDKSSDNFMLEKLLTNSAFFKVELRNENGKNDDIIEYNVEVIKDEKPAIEVNQIVDSSFFSEIMLSGDVQDDYGLEKLQLEYEILESGLPIRSGKIRLPLKKDLLQQSFLYYFQIDSILNQKNQTLKYRLSVWDNDQINGSKKQSSRAFTLRLPQEKEEKELINNTKTQQRKEFANSIKESESLKNDLEKASQMLKQKRMMNWEDKKLLEKILKKAENFDQQVENVEELQKKLNQQKEKFQNISPRLKQEAEQLSKNLEEFSADKEKEKLLEKIRELLEKQEEKTDSFRESVEELKKKQDYRDRELKRLMELFKRMEISYEMNQIGKDLGKLADEQKALGEKESKSLEDQQKASEKFEELQSALEETKRKNQKLNKPNPIKDTKEFETQIQQLQQESENLLKENNNSKAGEQQQKAGDEMKSLSQQLQQMQSSMQGENAQENMDNLRDIVDNLIKVSFRQEELKNRLENLNASDPQFLEISEKQLKLDEDMKIVEDSLYALSERVVQIQSFITEELTTLDKNVQRSIEYLKDRDIKRANASQQFAMSSMNNLSLMLDDVLQQMQMQMQSQQNMQSQNNQQPSLSEMQKALNQQTQQLNEGQKKGREYSEKLADLAEQQSRLRKQLEQSGENNDNPLNKGSDGNLSKMIEEMQEIEEDLVNKRLNGNLVRRQEQLMTRLLESEKSKKEQEEKDERQAETATEYEKRRPKAFEKYLKEKRKEIELLKRVPPNFTPYYKNEINKFYKKINTRK